MDDFEFNFGLSVLIAAALLVGVAIDYTGNENKVIHIKKVTTISNGGETNYKIFTKEGVFENTDRFFIGKFNSSDLQNQLIGERECKVHLMGHRIPFFSMYKDVTKIYWCKSNAKGNKDEKNTE